jgi:hypothetical protein
MGGESRIDCSLGMVTFCSCDIRMLPSTFSMFLPAQSVPYNRVTKGEESRYSNKRGVRNTQQTGFPPLPQMTIEILPSKRARALDSGVSSSFTRFCRVSVILVILSPLSPASRLFVLSFSLVRFALSLASVPMDAYMSRVRLSLTYSVLLDPLKLNTTHVV